MATVTFKNKRLVPEQLTTFGFVPVADNLVYQVPIVNDQFTLTITAKPDGTLHTRVTDNGTRAEYVLHLAPHATGEFVGQVAAEYRAVLQAVEAACYEDDVFQSDQVQALIAHVKATYGDQLEFLWKKFPQNAVYRRADTHKWYAALLTVSKTKLGLTSNESVTILDVRADPTEITRLVDHQTYFPGYHMNKKNWLTMILDGSVTDAELWQRLAESYRIAK